MACMFSLSLSAHRYISAGGQGEQRTSLQLRRVQPLRILSFDLISTARTSPSPSCLNSDSFPSVSFYSQKALPYTSIASTQTFVDENDKSVSLTVLSNLAGTM